MSDGPLAATLSLLFLPAGCGDQIEGSRPDEVIICNFTVRHNVRVEACITSATVMMVAFRMFFSFRATSGTLCLCPPCHLAI